MEGLASCSIFLLLSLPFQGGGEILEIKAPGLRPQLQARYPWAHQLSPPSLSFPTCKGKGMTSISVGGETGCMQVCGMGPDMGGPSCRERDWPPSPRPPWGGHVDLQTWLRSTAHGFLPWSLSGMFSLPSSFSSSSSPSCALSMGLFQCPRAPLGAAEPSPARLLPYTLPGCFQFGRHASCPFRS